MRAVIFLLASLPLLAQTPLDCHTMAKSGKRPQARACFEKLVRSSNAAHRAEGFWGIADYKAANEEFKNATAAQPKNPDVRVRWGRLFLERFNVLDAQKLFAEALEINESHPGALFGMALIASEGFDQKAVEFATKALEADPKLLEAQELLAKLALEDSNFDKAIADADKAITMSPLALDAMAVRASAELLRNRTGTEWFDRILKANPSYGQAWATAAHFLVLNRRYEEGIEFYRKSLELDPDLHSARSELGIQLMRLGEEKEAREQLVKAFEAGFQDNATINSLRLIDSYKNFLTFTTPSTIVKLHKKESDLLKPYVERELQRAVTTFEKKYKMKLTRPVQVEVYPDHEDFAVRTLGMPGLGALGVTFGYVVAMDSPSGRRPGTFHWASTLWHELSHVFVLTATKHRVPRWFTEGMAVHEETAVAPDWGDRLDPEAIRAIKDKRLLPVAELDRGFVRPKYPSQVTVSYFQAGRICDYIAGKWSYDKLLAMMHMFGEGKSTPEVVEEQLGMKPEEFDKQFLAWLEAQTKKTVDNFAEWRKRMKGIEANYAAAKHDEVIAEGNQLIDLYPDFVEAGNAYEIVAGAYEAKGDSAAAMKTLERYSAVGGRNPALLMKLAKQQEDAGKKQDAARTLARINFIYPMDETLHQRLGDLYMAEGNTAEAIHEFAAVVNSKPLDQATSRFKLAKALHSAQRMEEAKEQLLLALEAAPGYKPAQRLLLELSR